jgi:NAD(P)H-dependent flavin oxidoreductase YrpB (nitropropane dioxygenase family)
MIRTRFTELVGIEHPVMCGGMYIVGRAELAAAVSEAGGLGTITSKTQPTPEDLRREIRRVRELTRKPFAVNLNLFPSTTPTPNEGYIAVLLEEGVRIVETSGRSPEPYMKVLKDNGVIVIHKVPGARYAVTAERLGVDAVSVVGNETGGHPGMTDVGGLVMIPRTVDSVRIPVLAGGGIADGRGLAAALALGAEGVVMGTRFMATRESMVHENVKQWMLGASENDTVVIQRSIGSPSRVAKNRISLEVLEREQAGATLEELLPLISGARGRERVYEAGATDEGVWSCGQSVGLIHDIPPVAEVMRRIMDEAEAVLRRLGRLADPEA